MRLTPRKLGASPSPRCRAPSFKSLRFEAPRHLPDRTILIRFERRKPAGRVIVYYKGERMGEARLLDPVANDRKPETRVLKPDVGSQRTEAGSQKPEQQSETNNHKPQP